MTMLLKAQDTAAQRQVRAFAASGKTGHDLNTLSSKTASVFTTLASNATPASEINPILSDESSQAKLHEQIAGLKGQLEQDRLVADREIAAAFERGRDEGGKLALSLEQQKLDLLGASIDDAQTLLAERTQFLQTLSLQIAQLAMSRILGNHDRYAELIGDSIIYRTSQLSDELIVAVRVSPEDFAEPEALAALSSRVKRTDISTDPALASGACMFDLKLGRLDAGLTLQWNQLVHFLDKLVDADGAR